MTDDRRDKTDNEIVQEATTVHRDGFNIAAGMDNFDSFTDWVDYYERTRLEYEPKSGPYDRARLEIPDGTTFTIRNVYLWTTRVDGDWLVDIPESQLPTDIDLAVCRLIMFSKNGVPLFAGPLVDDGNSTPGENRTVRVENVDHAIN